MTDKEIIINGVDVSKCKWHTNLKMDCLELPTQPCKCANDPNCYFKQLARAKEEFEELRLYHNKCCKENAEKLEQWLEKYNQVSRDFYNGKYCNKENCSLLKAKCRFDRNLAQLEAHQYKQALDEIEKQVKAMNNECFYDDICDCNNCDMKNGCSYYRKFKILNIINKTKEQ